VLRLLEQEVHRRRHAGTSPTPARRKVVARNGLPPRLSELPATTRTSGGGRGQGHLHLLRQNHSKKIENRNSISQALWGSASVWANAFALAAGPRVTTQEVWRLPLSAHGSSVIPLPHKRFSAVTRYHRFFTVAIHRRHSWDVFAGTGHAAVLITFLLVAPRFAPDPTLHRPRATVPAAASPHRQPAVRRFPGPRGRTIYRPGADLQPVAGCGRAAPRPSRGVPRQVSQVCLGLGRRFHSMPPDQLISAIPGGPVYLCWERRHRHSTQGRRATSTPRRPGDPANYVRPSVIDAGQLRAKCARAQPFASTRPAMIEYPLGRGGLVQNRSVFATRPRGHL